MALKERTVVNKVEILPSGDIQAREAKQIFDTTITAVSYRPATYDADGVLLTEEVQAVSDVKAETFSRYVVNKTDVTPVEVQAFIDNTQVI